MARRFASLALAIAAGVLPPSMADAAQPPPAAPLATLTPLPAPSDDTLLYVEVGGQRFGLTLAQLKVWILAGQSGGSGSTSASLAADLSQPLSAGSMPLVP